MDRDTVLNAAPLMDGRIADRRQELKTQAISYVLNNREFSGPVSTFKIQAAVETEIGLELNEPAVRASLDELDDRGVVSHVKSDSYRIENTISGRDLYDRIDDIWLEYKNRLRESDADQGFDYKLDNQREAFEEVFIRFFEEIRGQTDSLENYTGQKSVENQLDPVITDVANDLPLQDPDVFEEEIRDYLSEGTSELLDFIGTIYTGIINYDILSKEDEIGELDFKNAPSEEKKLFLDTNILIGLLCETDQLHPVVSSMCERASEFGYDLYYLPSTSEELQYNVDKVKNTIKGFPQDESNPNLDHQFVRDFRNRDDRTRAQYITELDRWSETLSDEWDIEMWSAKIDADDQEKILIENWVEKLDEIEGDGTKARPQIRHDTELIAATLQTRNETGQDIVVGPFAVSNNDSLLSINEMGKGELWNKGVAIHPQDWLDFLIAFTPVEFTENDKKEIAEAVLATATKFDDEIDLQGYLDILSIRADLSGKSKSYLEDMVYGTPLENKLMNAIQRGDYQELENQGQKLLSEINDLLKEKVERDDQLKKAANKAQEERQRRQQLEEVLEDMNAVEVNNVQNVSQDVEVKVQQQTINQLEFLESQLRDATEEPLEESDIPSPPQDYSDPNKVIEWLQQLDEKISTIESYGQRFGHLAPMITGLLGSFGV